MSARRRGDQSAAASLAGASVAPPARATRWDGPPGFLGEPYAEPRLGWDLSADGQRLFAARNGVEVYGLVGRDHPASLRGYR